MAIDYFSEAELRALPQMSDTAVYTTARVESAAAYVTEIVERVVGTSFVSRTVTDEVHDGGTYAVLLRESRVLSVTSATENGVTVTDDLDGYGGLLTKKASGGWSPLYWADGHRNVSVTYEAGYSSVPPGDVKEAVIQGTRARLLSTNSNAQISDRQTSMTTEFGTTSFVVAGVDRPTGYPEVDAVILGWRDRLNVLGFA